MLRLTRVQARSVRLTNFVSLSLPWMLTSMMNSLGLGLGIGLGQG